MFTFATSFLLGVYSLYVYSLLLYLMTVVAAFLMVSLASKHLRIKKQRLQGVAFVGSLAFLQVLATIAQKHYYV